MESKTIYVGLRLSPRTIEKIDDRIRDGHGINRQDYIRQLIYSDLVE